MSTRLAAVLDVIYLVFNEGFTAHCGSSLQRVDLCRQACSMAISLLPSFADNAELLGLLALMEFQLARHEARVDPCGELVLLEHQDRATWDRQGIRRGFVYLARATQSGLPAHYQLQAHIAACHVRASRWEDTDWPAIAALYERLRTLASSPVVELNCAVAIGMAHGARAGLRRVESLRHGRALARYALLPAVRAELLRRLGRFSQARREYRRALTLTTNLRERTFLEMRIRGCGP